MPNRILRQNILESARVSQLNWADEVFYRRLMSVVDDYGRTEANPLLLRSKCYPLQTDQVRAADISRSMAACQKAGLIVCYDVDGKQYLELLRFGQQQRTASKFPPPPTFASNCYQEISNAHLVGDVFGDVDVVDKPASRVVPLPKKPKDTLMPDDFCISEAVRSWAQEKGHTRLEERLEHFRGYARANGKRYADWDQAFMNAIRGNWAKLDAAPSQGSTKVAL